MKLYKTSKIKQTINNSIILKTTNYGFEKTNISSTWS